MIGTHTTLEEVLHAKEQRVLRQNALLDRFPHMSLISLSVNIPGSLKLSHEAVVIFECMRQAIQKRLKQTSYKVLHEEFHRFRSGAEGLIVIDTPALELKSMMCFIEEHHPLGRLMDIDVLDATAQSVSRTALGLTPRRCLVCNEDAKRCARMQAHTYESLHAEIKRLTQMYAWQESIALWCERAMRVEVELTPKPGLVDQTNSGAHRDMDIHTFYTSIDAIKPFLTLFLETAYIYGKESPVTTFSRMREIGIACEKAMFQATNNVNTHKGMVFCLALVCGAIGRLKARDENLTCNVLQTEIQAMCEGLIERDLRGQNPHSAGMRFFHETGSTGIRGVAQSGFADVFEKSLPFFLERLQHADETVALQQTLLYLMSFVEDSTLWSRGGLEGLRSVQNEAIKNVHVVFSKEALNVFLTQWDQTLIEKNLSPGGSADLLALTWLLSKITQ